MVMNHIIEDTRKDETSLSPDEQTIKLNDKIYCCSEIMKNNLLNHLAANSAAIAHEVRNPLQTLQAWLNTLEDNQDLNNEQLEMIKEELKRADHLLTDFLGMFRDYEASFKSCDLNCICQRVVMLLNSSAVLKIVEIKEDYAAVLPRILCDESKIKQILINLLTNALDVSQQGDCITISTYVDDELIYMSVLDQGKGVPEEVRDLIFKPFFTDKTDGTGVGLFISQQIAREHGGDLYLLNSNNQGARFVMCLPINK
jgi:signal transduction histidine kinase